MYDVSPAYLLGVVSEEEGNLLLKYQKLDALGKAVVLRAAGVEKDDKTGEVSLITTDSVATPLQGEAYKKPH